MLIKSSSGIYADVVSAICHKSNLTKAVIEPRTLASKEQHAIQISQAEKRRPAATKYMWHMRIVLQIGISESISLGA